MIDVNNWNWPQWVKLALYMLALIRAIITHGKPSEPENAIICFISLIIGLFILIQGGFFK